MKQTYQNSVLSILSYIEDKIWQQITRNRVTSIIPIQSTLQSSSILTDFILMGTDNMQSKRKGIPNQRSPLPAYKGNARADYFSIRKSKKIKNELQKLQKNRRNSNIKENKNNQLHTQYSKLERFKQDQTQIDKVEKTCNNLREKIASIQLHQKNIDEIHEQRIIQQEHQNNRMKKMAYNAKNYTFDYNGEIQKRKIIVKEQFQNDVVFRPKYKIGNKVNIKKMCKNSQISKEITLFLPKNSSMYLKKEQKILEKNNYSQKQSKSSSFDVSMRETHKNGSRISRKQISSFNDGYTFNSLDQNHLNIFRELKLKQFRKYAQKNSFKQLESNPQKMIINLQKVVQNNKPTQKVKKKRFYTISNIGQKQINSPSYHTLIFDSKNHGIVSIQNTKLYSENFSADTLNL